jgi:alkylhydroperoxidase family enzyme
MTNRAELSQIFKNEPWQNPALIGLVRLRIALLHGCESAEVVHRAELESLGEHRSDEVVQWPNSSVFTAKERAALELAEVISLEESEESCEDVLHRAKRHLSAREIIELVLAITATNECILAEGVGIS